LPKFSYSLGKISRVTLKEAFSFRLGTTGARGGVQRGIRFLLARESGAYRRRLLAATEVDTVVTRVLLAGQGVAEIVAKASAVLSRLAGAAPSG
jgi:NAD(P)H-dependent flavin oxidoreductase YrpB (nitropropane dioxygenase family)